MVRAKQRGGKEGNSIQELLPLKLLGYVSALDQFNSHVKDFLTFMQNHCEPELAFSFPIAPQPQPSQVGVMMEWNGIACSSSCTVTGHQLARHSVNMWKPSFPDGILQAGKRRNDTIYSNWGCAWPPANRGTEFYQKEPGCTLLVWPRNLLSVCQVPQVFSWVPAKQTYTFSLMLWHELDDLF